MSDIEIETPVLEASPEARTWARQMIEQYRAVDALHHAVPRWQVHEDDEFSYDTKEDAIEASEAPDLEPTFFLICEHCGHLESWIQKESVGSEWSFRESLYPCATARAMGHTE